MGHINMTAKNQLNVIFILLLLTSCSRTRNLSTEDFEWMPYNGNESLVFNSNSGEIDTIFLLKKDTLFAYPDAPNPFGSKNEEVAISCRHTDPWPPDGKHRYLENLFVQLEKAKDGQTRLSVNLSAKNAAFYRLEGIIVDSLGAVKPIELKTSNNVFKDVYVIKSIDYLEREKQNDYVTRLYWSKSQGLVRYDKSDRDYWELRKKYGP